MFGRKPALAIGALIGLTFCWTAFAQDQPAAPRRPAGANLQVAQYDGPPYGGPEDFDGPPGGYGPPGMEGPPPGYGRGPGPEYENGYRPRRRATHSQGGGSVQHVTYHGFHIDVSEGGGSRNLTGQIASMEHQIDIVGSVGLSMSDLSLFRSLPIKITNRLNGGGHYDGGPVVQMGSLKASDQRPVLLHEFMHVYHHSHLPGGFQNPDIHAFYEEAVSRNLYEPGSYMLKNQGEFFAMTASCYLYGTVARPPYNRDTIRKQQPDYYAYLGHLFGAPHGSHSSGAAQSWLMRHGPSGYGGEGPDGAYN